MELEFDMSPVLRLVASPDGGRDVRDELA